MYEGKFYFEIHLINTVILLCGSMTTQILSMQRTMIRCAQMSCDRKFFSVYDHFTDTIQSNMAI